MTATDAIRELRGTGLHPDDLAPQRVVPRGDPGRQADNPEIVLVKLDDDTRRAAATRCTIHAGPDTGYAETHDRQGNLLSQTGPDADTLAITDDTRSIRLIGDATIVMPAEAKADADADAGDDDG